MNSNHRNQISVIILMAIFLFPLTATARWTSVDPKASKFPSISPYAYCDNNPISNIDPDGQETVFAGTTAERQVNLSITQQLTNDKLAMKSDGTMLIKSLGTENVGNNLQAGTALLRFHNQKGPGSHTITIRPTAGKNSTLTSTGANIVGNNPGPGANSVIQFNSVLNNGGVDITGSRTRKPAIGLAHELDHAKTNALGLRDNTKTNVKDPDTSKRGVLSKTEVSTRAAENRIRKEQKVPLRKEPIK